MLFTIFINILSEIMAFPRMNHFIQKPCPAERQSSGEVYILGSFVHPKGVLPDKFLTTSPLVT